MKTKKWLTIITLIITALSLVLAFIIGKNSNCITYDISMAIFGGAALGFLFLVKHFSITTKSRIRILKFGNGVCVTAKKKLLSEY